MTTPGGSQQPPPVVDGTAREAQAALAAAEVAAAYAAAENALIAAIASTVKATLAAPGAARAQGVKLARRIAAILRAARASIRGEAAKVTEDALDQAGAYASRTAQNVYWQAITAAIDATRGGLPATQTSLSAMQAAQKALDRLTAEGITGFTDRTGRRWSLPAYVEMATRTAISQRYDDLQNGAMLRAGIDLIWTYTDSTQGSCPRCLPWIGKVLSLTGYARASHDAEVRLADGSVFRRTVTATLDQAKAAGFRHPGCRCNWTGLYDGVNLDVLGQGAEPPSQAAAVYKASQQQRALERRVRDAGRAAAAAITPAARRKAREKLAAARAASARHRTAHHIRQTKVDVKRREHPHGPPGGPAR